MISPELGIDCELEFDVETIDSLAKIYGYRIEFIANRYAIYTPYLADWRWGFRSKTLAYHKLITIILGENPIFKRD